MADNAKSKKKAETATPIGPGGKSSQAINATAALSAEQLLAKEKKVRIELEGVLAKRNKELQI